MTPEQGERYKKNKQRAELLAIATPIAAAIEASPSAYIALPESIAKRSLAIAQCMIDIVGPEA